MISVIIPLYNKEKTISQAIASVLSQTYSDYEIIVVDDGSTDNSVKVVNALIDRRIRLVHQDNAGVAAARNRGIAEAYGEFIALLDADDLWKPDFLKTVVDLSLKYRNCDIYATNYEYHHSDGKIQSTILNRIPFEKESGVLDNYFIVASCSNSPVCSSAVMIRKTAIVSVGGFPVGIKSGEDLLTWARLAARYRIAFHMESKAIYVLESSYNSIKPVRAFVKNDEVGAQLVKLLRQNSDLKGLSKYVAHWHKMRSSIAIRSDECFYAIKEALLSIRYNPLNFKVYPFILLAILPPFLRHSIIKRSKK